jgi:hypothetical protein
MGLPWPCDGNTLPVEYLFSKDYNGGVPIIQRQQRRNNAKQMNEIPDAVYLPPGELLGERTGHSTTEIVYIQLDLHGGVVESWTWLLQRAPPVAATRQCTAQHVIIPEKRGKILDPGGA